MNNDTMLVNNFTEDELAQKLTNAELEQKRADYEAKLRQIEQNGYDSLSDEEYATFQKEDELFGKSLNPELIIEKIIKDYEEKQKQIESEGIDSLSKEDREIFEKEKSLFDKMRVSLDYTISGSDYMLYPDKEQVESLLPQKQFYSGIHNLTADNNKSMLNILYSNSEGRRNVVDGVLASFAMFTPVRDGLLGYKDVPITLKEIAKTLDFNERSMKTNITSYKPDEIYSRDEQEREKSRANFVLETERCFDNEHCMMNTFIIASLALELEKELVQKETPVLDAQNTNEKSNGTKTVEYSESTDVVSKKQNAIQREQDEKPAEITVVSKGEVLTNATTAKQYAEVNQKTQIGNSNDRILQGAVQQSTTDINEANGNTYYVHEEQGDVERQRGEPTKSEITEKSEQTSKTDLGDKEVTTAKSSKTTTSYER